MTVDEFMSSLKHPQVEAIQAMRKAIVGADSRIAEGVKWNAPSFRTSEYFATTHLRMKEGVGLILHYGAKVRDMPSIPIDDPERLLTWLAKDRAVVAFKGLDDVIARTPALQGIVRQWIRNV